MIQPRVFGTVNGYQWEEDGFPAPHLDYCSLYSNEYSVRVWEPDRMRLSSPGVYGVAAQPYESVSLPTRAHIKGIKGNAMFRFDGTVDGVGVWLNDFGVPLDPQPSAFRTYAALAGVPKLNLGQGQPWGFDTMDFGLAPKIPLFCAMYTGTYKQIDSAAGWEIDSGPGDDQDVLLGLDITSPDVLESGRLKWWDVEYCTLPRCAPFFPWGDKAADLPGLGVSQHEQSTGFGRPDAGSHHRYALNLSQNHRLGPDKVLWLHWKTGIIRLPVLVTSATDPEGTVECRLYANHRFNVNVHASMIVDTDISYD